MTDNLPPKPWKASTPWTVGGSGIFDSEDNWVAECGNRDAEHIVKCVNRYAERRKPGRLKGSTKVDIEKFRELLAGGCSISQMAGLLDCCPRTICTLKARVRKAESRSM